MESAGTGKGGLGSSQKRAGWLVATLAVLIVFLLILLGLSLSYGGSILPKSPGPSPAILEVTGIDRNFVYSNGTNGSLGPEVNDSCAMCPVTVQAGSLVSFTLLTFKLDASVPDVFMKVYLNTSIPTEPIGGWGCPSSGPCPPPAVTSSHFILIEVNGDSGAWDAVFDPPSNATAADDGLVYLLVFVAPCSTNEYAWNYCELS
jgi:hypothetical protein